MKILLADDNPEVRSALRLLLEQEPVPATITEAADSKALLADLVEDCATILLLDWELPGLQRDDVLNTARSSCSQMKIIALSSRFEARQEALAAQVDAFISKSEPPEKILSTLAPFIPQTYTK
jgi:DNA-binding NarL/FixJ family response regulator